MLDFITNLEINIIVGAVALICGVAFSTKVKDWYKGIPSQLRAAISNVEGDALAKIKQAQADVLAKIAPAAPAPKVALKPSEQPIAPVAATPIPAAAAAPVVEPAAPVA